MKLRVNGDERDLDAGSTLAELLRTLNLPETGIAVAIDGAVVPRSTHRDRVLADGESVEVIRAVGGG